MGRTFLLVITWVVFGWALFANAGRLVLNYGPDKTSINLKCDYTLATSITWYRNDTRVFPRSHRSPGGDFKNRLIQINWKKISLQISPKDNGTYWQCCAHFWKFFKRCSGLLRLEIVVNSTASGENRSSELIPEHETFINGTLNLTKEQEEPFQVTLSCTIDGEIEESKWIVGWLKNNSMVWLTNGTSTVRTEDGFSSNGSTSTAVEDEVHVASSPHQYNVTFNITEETIGTWNCFNWFLRVNNKLSNNITIDTTVDFSQGETSSATQDEVTTSATTQDVGTASQTTPDEEKTSASTPFTVTPFATTEDVGRISQTTQNANSTPVGNQDANVGLRGTLPSPVSPSSLDGKLPVIAGTLCGVIALLIICVILVILLRRNRKTKEAQEKKSGGPQSDTREGIVMEDNELYEGGTFDYTADTKTKEVVMEDNELYKGGTMKDKDTGKNEIVMEDNTIYEGGNYTLAGDVEKEQIEMKANDMYSSSP